MPEYSVDTRWLADRFSGVVRSHPRVTLMMNTVVDGVAEAADGRWEVGTSEGRFSGFDVVVNCLWEGRMAVDATAGVAPTGVWSNRYRQSLFVQTTSPMDVPNAIIGTGPFGDVKNYGNGRYYLSWYPDGLRVDSSELRPPDLGTIAMPDRDAFIDAVFAHLGSYLPAVGKIRAAAETIEIGGGWVFAAGRGQLSDPTSSLHKRTSSVVTLDERYFSVDTGKYSTAPLMARTLADRIIPDG